MGQSVQTQSGNIERLRRGGQTPRRSASVGGKTKSDHAFLAPEYTHSG